ncbi:MAG: hypothetical protein BIFFINMI_03854 [Phycisphaerae bacterium]|nr:hypothetical protein [Phycisphaerae bacterium]
MITASPIPSPTLHLRTDAWYGDREIALPFPPGWTLDVAAPADAPEMSDEAIDAALACPIGTPPIRELVRGRRSAVIAVDDLARPTPAHRLLPPLLREMEAGGMTADRVLILVGMGTHRPLTDAEIELKIGRPTASRVRVIQHDYLGPDVRFFGWMDGVPVSLNRYLLEADARFLVGATMPGTPMGFGGGAKMVVPGLAGVGTIAWMHGAADRRRPAQTRSAGPRDARLWAERVARRVGIDAILAAQVNSRRELAGLSVGDVVEAHRAGCLRALAIGRTVITRDRLAAADAVVVNRYPEDVTGGNLIHVPWNVPQFKGRLAIQIAGAPDGTGFHGIGVADGLAAGRLLSNLPRWLRSPRILVAAARSLPLGPRRTARFLQLMLNAKGFDPDRVPRRDRPPVRPLPMCAAGQADMLAWSPGCPAEFFARRFRRGRLYRHWEDLSADLARRMPGGRALVLPCQPVQVIDWA